MSKFDELLAAIDTEAVDQDILAKSLTGEPPAVAAVEGAGATPAADAVDADGNPIVAAVGENGAPLAKSLQNPEDQGGEEIAVDDLIKSLVGLDTRMDETESLMAKAIEGAVGLIQRQGLMIKSLGARIDELANKGSGRKALVVATDRAQPGEHMAKSIPQATGPHPTEILAKCLDAQKLGKLTGSDVARAESQLNHGVAVDPRILAALS